MTDRGLLVLDATTVAELLDGCEEEIVEAVRAAYLAHRAGDSMLPSSVFLRFPDRPRDRIIALPAYLGGQNPTAGVKWIASVPGNVASGHDRASAVLVLNATDTGVPHAILEASAISAQRTAASAALAAEALWPDVAEASIAVLGCGVIAYETLRFVLLGPRPVRGLTLFDPDVARARYLESRCARGVRKVSVAVAPTAEAALADADVVILATSATSPHIHEVDQFKQGATILHISLRDIAADVIVAVENVVDDLDHVCRAETSIHLAERLIGHRGFVGATLADVLAGAAPPRRQGGATVVFTPFGLGILDLAVGQLVVERARATGRGLFLPSFLPQPWSSMAGA